MKITYIITAALCIVIIALILLSMTGIRAAGAELDWPETKFFTDADVEMIAKTIWGEARGCSKTQKEAVAWCILNRVDDERFPDTIERVITAPGQFFGYSESNPMDDAIYELARKILLVWATEEMMPADERERILPMEYVFFSGNGRENTFTTAYMGGETWDFAKYENDAADELTQVYGVC